MKRQEREEAHGREEEEAVPKSGKEEEENAFCKTGRFLIEAMTHLAGLNEFQRCDYIMTLCEEIGATPDFVYEERVKTLTGRVIIVNVLSIESSMRSFSRVLSSSPNSELVLRQFLQAYSGRWLYLLENLDPEVDLSLFSPFVKESRRVLPEMQTAGFQSVSPKIIQWLIRDGLFDPLVRDHLLLDNDTFSTPIT